MLNKSAIEEFQKIYKHEFGGEISFEEASAQAGNLLRLYKAVYKNNFSPDKETDHGKKT